MSKINSALPGFSCPPLTEVALSVQFEPLEGLHVPQMGLLWSNFRSHFPRVEEHPPIEPVIERLGGRKPLVREPKFEMLSGPPVPRCWFIDESGCELVQVQQDRFVRNWRKVSESSEYPRYEDHVRPNFIEDYERFCDFLGAEGIGELTPNQCEVTYINHICSNGVWQNHNQLEKVFLLWNRLDKDNVPLEMERARMALSFIMDNAQGEFLGRLHLAVEPAFRKLDDSPIFVVTLTARCRPLGNDLDGIIQSLDLCRENIVLTFDAVTTTEMHKVWGKVR